MTVVRLDAPTLINVVHHGVRGALRNQGIDLGSITSGHYPYLFGDDVAAFEHKLRK